MKDPKLCFLDFVEKNGDQVLGAAKEVQTRFFIRPPGKAWIEIDHLRYLQYLGDWVSGVIIPSDEGFALACVEVQR